MYVMGLAHNALLQSRGETRGSCELFIFSFFVLFLRLRRLGFIFVFSCVASSRFPASGLLPDASLFLSKVKAGVGLGRLIRSCEKYTLYVRVNAIYRVCVTRSLYRAASLASMINRAENDDASAKGGLCVRILIVD